MVQIRPFVAGEFAETAHDRVLRQGEKVVAERRVGGEVGRREEGEGGAGPEGVAGVGGFGGAAAYAGVRGGDWGGGGG